MGRISGKVAIITGATSGIGEATAILFAKEGAIVICVGRSEERGRAVIEKINQSCEDAEACFYACDVSDVNQVSQMRKYVQERFGRLDILFNNAGIWLTSSLENISDEEWHRIYKTNVDAAMYMTREYMSMLQESRGVILNNASVGGLQSHIAGGAQYAYASSKAALIQFSQLCALNYSEKVRVNCICPGVTVTPIFQNRDFTRFDGTIPMGRMGQPEEIAKAALFLVSDDASYITGACLTVDGGASIK